MDVLFVTRSLDVGGAERQLVQLAARLSARGHRVRVATFYAGGPLEGDLHAAGVPVVDLAKRGRWDVAGFVRRWLSVVRDDEPDVVHGYLVAPNLACAALRLFGRDVATVWGVRASDMDLSRYEAFDEATFQISRHAARLADRIIVNSEAGRRFHVDRGYPGHRMVVVPNGIDTERFRPRPGERARARRDLGLAPDVRVVGLVARLDPMKDHGTFLDAAARLASRAPDVNFVAIGGGPPGVLEAWRRRVLERGLAGRVRFAGPRADVERVYAAFDVATSTSAFGEGFPNAVGEAMASGVPCVVTDVGDAARIVGDTGIVVRPGDPRGLANGWQTALDRGERSVGDAARSRIETRFSLTRLVERTEAVLRDASESRS